MPLRAALLVALLDGGEELQVLAAAEAGGHEFGLRGHWRAVGRVNAGVGVAEEARSVGWTIAPVGGYHAMMRGSGVPAYTYCCWGLGDWESAE